MKKFWSWLFRKKTIISWVIIVNIIDFIQTYFLSKTFPGMFIETNPVVAYFLESHGPELTFLLISPLIMILAVLLIFEFWDKKSERWYCCFLLCLILLGRTIGISVNAYTIIKLINIMGGA